MLVELINIVRDLLLLHTVEQVLKTTTTKQTQTLFILSFQKRLTSLLAILSQTPMWFMLFVWEEHEYPAYFFVPCLRTVAAVIPEQHRPSECRKNIVKDGATVVFSFCLKPWWENQMLGETFLPSKFSRPNLIVFLSRADSCMRKTSRLLRADIGELIQTL